MNEAALVLVVFIALVAIFLRWYLSADQVTKRALRAVPFSRVRDAKSGALVKLKGRVVRKGRALRSPLSSRACVHFCAEVEEKRSGSKGRSYWATIADETESVDFYLDDGTGRALVRMDRAHVALVRDEHSRSGTFDDADARQKAFLARHGKRSETLFGLVNRTLRYTEGALEEDEDVCVLGSAVWVRRRKKNGDSVLRLEIGAPSGGTLHVSDDPMLLG